MGEIKKPDYLDTDWTALIADREKKWEQMLREFEERGIQKIPLWEKKEYPVVHCTGFVPGLLLFPPHKETRGTLIVCAGGGFTFKSSNEAKEVAEYFYEKGLNVAILDYAVNEKSQSSEGPFAKAETLKAACEDAKRAVRLLRCHAEEWNLLPDKIGFGGFSAGGVVTSLLLTHYDEGDITKEDPAERISSRPDATFQMYGSFRNSQIVSALEKTGIIGFDFKAVNQSAGSDFVLNLPVDAPPMFLAQTDADNPGYILDMGRAYYERGVPFEVHLFHGGPHGGGLYDGKHEDAPYFPHTAHWAELAAEWFIMQGF